MARIQQTNNPIVLMDNYKSIGDSDIYVRSNLSPIKVTVKLLSISQSSSAVVNVYTGDANFTDRIVFNIQLSNIEHTVSVVIRNIDRCLMCNIQSIAGAGSAIVVVVDPYIEA